MRRKRSNDTPKMKKLAAHPSEIRLVSCRIFPDGAHTVQICRKMRNPTMTPAEASVFQPGDNAARNSAGSRSSLETQTNEINNAAAATESRSLHNLMFPSIDMISLHLSTPLEMCGRMEVNLLRYKMTSRMARAVIHQFTLDAFHWSPYSCPGISEYVWSCPFSSGIRKCPCTKASSAGRICKVSTE